jgi:Domain of unknown function (DUF4863)
MGKAEFEGLVAEVTRAIAGKPLGEALEAELNAIFPPTHPTFGKIEAACHAAIVEGWMCSREAPGIKYGRVTKPSPELAGFSIDVVDMEDCKGPHHRHPNGEIDMIMPITPGAQFDGHPAGWRVYGPSTAHYPTVSGGQALVLYLLPDGAIEFTKT